MNKLDRNSGSNQANNTCSVSKIPPTSRPSDAELKEAISAAFDDQFPPKSSESLALMTASLKLKETVKGAVPFTFEAEVFVGGIFENVKIGTKSFSGSYDLKTGEATFKEVASKEIKPPDAEVPGARDSFS